MPDTDVRKAATAAGRADARKRAVLLREVVGGRADYRRNVALWPRWLQRKVKGTSRPG